MLSELSRKAGRHTLFTWSKQEGVERKIISRAQGVYFWDENGKKYLDFSSQLINVNLGHSHPALKKAISSQLDILDYSAPSFISKPKVKLAKLLADLTDLDKVLFTTGGGEANENAIIIARQVSGKDIVLSRDPSYHGATYGARTATHDITRNLPCKFDTPFFQHFSTPKCSFLDKEHKSCCQRSLNELEHLIDKFNNKIAAVILEPIPGGQGVLIPSDKYLPVLVNLCRKNGIFVIFDEVMTGFGRTGKWFSYQHWKVTPDIVTLSKGINGGIVPLGAVVVSKDIANFFDNNKLLTGLTNSGHPVSCAAGVEAIRIYKEEDLAKKSATLGKVLKSQLVNLRNKYQFIAEVRGLGLFSAIEFGKSKNGISPETIAEMVSKETYRLGLYLYYHLDCLLIAPPLTINQNELFLGLNILDNAIENILVKHLERVN